MISDRDAKHVYMILKEHFANQEPKAHEINQKYNDIMQRMGACISKYEQTRADIMNQFKMNVQKAYDKYHAQFEKESQNAEEKEGELRRTWEQIQPGMEALAQIKAIIKNNFVVRGNNTNNE